MRVTGQSPGKLAVSNLRVKVDWSGTRRETPRTTAAQSVRPLSAAVPQFSANLGPFSWSRFLRVDAISRKRPATQVVDEQIVRDGQVEPGPPRFLIPQVRLIRGSFRPVFLLLILLFLVVGPWGQTEFQFRNATEITSWFDSDLDLRPPPKGAQVHSQGRSPPLDQGPKPPSRPAPSGAEVGGGAGRRIPSRGASAPG